MPTKSPSRTVPLPPVDKDGWRTLPFTYQLVDNDGSLLEQEPRRNVSSLLGYGKYLGSNTRTAGQLAGSFPTVRKIPVVQHPLGALERQGVAAFNETNTGGVINVSSSEMNNRSLPHEIGHSIWDVLPQDQKNQWTHIHNTYIDKLPDDIYNNLDLKLPYNERQSSVENGDTIALYAHSPEHSFAETVGKYASEPYTLEREEPRVYNWLKSVMGREFKERNIREAMNPALSVPLPGVPEK